MLLQKCSQSRFCVFAKDLPHKNVDNAIKMPEIEFIERLLMLFCFYVFLYPSMQQSFFAFLIGNCISIVRNFIFLELELQIHCILNVFIASKISITCLFLCHFFTFLVSKIVHYYNNLPISVCKCSF